MITIYTHVSKLTLSLSLSGNLSQDSRTMDCSVPVDDLCQAWQADNLRIPKETPSDTVSDQFFILFQVETIYPHEDEEEELVVEDFLAVSESYTFWAPCPRTERDNLPEEKISDMLSMAGVPLHKQDVMMHTISSRADDIANEPDNKGRRVLPMLVSVSLIACWCCPQLQDH